MNDDLLMLLVFLVVVMIFMWIGGVIGELGGKKNGLVGALLGLLGPVGWVIVAVLPANAMPAQNKRPVVHHRAKLQAIDPVDAWEKAQEIDQGPPAPRAGWKERLKSED